MALDIKASKPKLPMGQYHKVETWKPKPKTNLIPDNRLLKSTSNCGNFIKRFLLFLLSSITSLPVLTPQSTLRCREGSFLGTRLNWQIISL